jgi:predicted  nucleic acid-binding Zn-ribbon protein
MSDILARLRKEIASRQAIRNVASLLKNSTAESERLRNALADCEGLRAEYERIREALDDDRDEIERHGAEIEAIRELMGTRNTNVPTAISMTAIAH